LFALVGRRQQFALVGRRRQPTRLPTPLVTLRSATVPRHRKLGFVCKVLCRPFVQTVWCLPWAVRNTRYTTWHLTQVAVRDTGGSRRDRGSSRTDSPRDMPPCNMSPHDMPPYSLQHTWNQTHCIRHMPRHIAHMLQHIAHMPRPMLQHIAHMPRHMPRHVTE